jgi:hypothetical protein
MKKLYIAVAILIAVAITESCKKQSIADETLTTKIIETNSFNKVTVAEAFKVNIKKGETFKVEVKGRITDVNDLDISNSSKDLSFKYKTRRNDRKALYINITGPYLQQLTTTGASEAIVDYDEFMKLILSGASKVSLNMHNGVTEADVSGTSVLNISGNNTHLLANLSGSGTIQGTNYVTENADLSLSGTTFAEIRVNVHLKANASGAGIVYYQGEPQTEITTSGAGKVQHKELLTL